MLATDDSAVSTYPGKRGMDLVFAGAALLLAWIPMLIVALLVKMTSPGPVLYWSDRIGLGNRVYRMPKFRTMRVDTPPVATHLMLNPDAYLTSIGGFLRKTSLDELPQLWSILVGDMSVVGPRPALYNQTDLIALRTEAGIHKLIPGLTGWAQINGRDEIAIGQKVKFDMEYLQRKSLCFDLKIVFLTFVRVLDRHGVAH